MGQVLHGSATTTAAIRFVERHRSRWFRGPFALALADPRPEPFMPVRGQVGLFRVKP
jgi:hypothetical protein